MKTHAEQSALFQQLSADLIAAGVLEAGWTYPTDTRPEARPLHNLDWKFRTAHGESPLRPYWRKDVAPDDPARGVYRDLAGKFLVDIQS